MNANDDVNVSASETNTLQPAEKENESIIPSKKAPSAELPTTEIKPAENTNTEKSADNASAQSAENEKEKPTEAEAKSAGNTGTEAKSAGNVPSNASEKDANKASAEESDEKKDSADKKRDKPGALREPKKKGAGSAGKQKTIDLDTIKTLTVSPSPHIKSPENTRTMMLDVIIMLIPVLVWGIYMFGFRALTICAVSVTSCVVFEALTRLILRRSFTLGDLSAVVTGMLLGLNLPATVPLWLPVLGAFFAIVIVKQLFGGIGKNIVNPALAARVFLFSSWPTLMTAFSEPHTRLSAFAVTLTDYDAVASATPLAVLKTGQYPDISLTDLLIGNCPGVIGEVPALLIIGCGIYLIARKTITWHIPVSFIATVGILTAIFPTVTASSDVNALNFMAYELCSGGLLLGAVFMATDYATAPITPVGRLLYGVGCGLITVFIRYFGAYPEGVSFAILIMNLLVWYLDRLTKPKVFGGGAAVAKK